MQSLPQEVKNYLDECKKQNLPAEQVLSGLIQQNWSTDILSQAKQYYVTQEAASVTPPSPEPVAKLPGIPPDYLTSQNVVVRNTDPAPTSHTKAKVISGLVIGIAVIFTIAVLTAYGAIPIGKGPIQSA